ncbi:MAG: PilZ domain-containing protein [Betaproteobacteria bacterium]|nr:PilZ domain-containing protein [Betaproteobacteria bacterium]
MPHQPKPLLSCPPREETDNMRQYQRLLRPYRVEARPLCFPMPPHPVINAPCYDIGAGGLCVEASRSFEIGELMQIRVHVPKLNKYSPSFFKSYENDAEQYVQCIGKVAWVRSSGGKYLVGLNFTDIDPDQRKALKNLVQKAMQAQS